jgi:hypothetical protein
MHKASHDNLTEDRLALLLRRTLLLVRLRLIIYFVKFINNMRLIIYLIKFINSMRWNDGVV